jgi:hypothetical protein
MSPEMVGGKSSLAGSGPGSIRFCCPACGHCLETMSLAEPATDRRKQKRYRILTATAVICPSCGAEGRLKAVPVEDGPDPRGSSGRVPA